MGALFFSPLISLQSGPGASIACCTKPRAARSTPFHTIRLMTSRLPRLVRQCFTAIIADRAVANQSTTLRWSMRSTQNGIIGTGGLGSNPSAMSRASHIEQRPLFTNGISSITINPIATHTSGSRFRSYHTRSRASYVVS